MVRAEPWASAAASSSTPIRHEEFRECLLKAEFLTGPAHRATTPIAENVRIVSQPDKFSLIETMLWEGGYPLLELHLDRLEDSASYFGFACDRAAVKAKLEAHARQFADSAPRKVRMLCDAEGNAQIGSEVIRAASATDRIGRAGISRVRTDPADPTLYHKTTQRALYGLEYGRAIERGCDDMLFLNLRGEVTEGAISNIFIEKDGRWFTPPIECGLLPGVYRRHLLETRPEIEERVLFDGRSAPRGRDLSGQRSPRSAPRGDQLVRESRNVVFLGPSFPWSLGPCLLTPGASQP